MRELYYIEDDAAIAQIAAEYLEQRGFHVTVLPSVASAKQQLLQKKPDLCLIDWNMPDGKGDALCRFIRMRWRELPVIFLTVRGAASEIVEGLDCGADDYIVKPFDLTVLHSRIRALLRRSNAEHDSVLTCDDLLLNQSQMTVFCKGEEISVTQTEYQLLLALLQRKGQTVKREQLLNEVWDSNGAYVNNNTLTVAMKRLREKLHQPSCLKTVRSFGYRMEDTI